MKDGAEGNATIKWETQTKEAGQFTSPLKRWWFSSSTWFPAKLYASGHADEKYGTCSQQEGQRKLKTYAFFFFFALKIK